MTISLNNALAACALAASLATGAIAAPTPAAKAPAKSAAKKEAAKSTAKTAAKPAVKAKAVAKKPATPTTAQRPQTKAALALANENPIMSMINREVKTTPCSNTGLVGSWGLANLMADAPKDLSRDKITAMTDKTPTLWPNQIVIFTGNGKVNYISQKTTFSVDEFKAMEQSRADDKSLAGSFTVDPKNALVKLQGLDKTAPSQFNCVMLQSDAPKLDIKKGDVLFKSSPSLDGKPWTIVSIWRPVPLK